MVDFEPEIYTHFLNPEGMNIVSVGSEFAKGIVVAKRGNIIDICNSKNEANCKICPVVECRFNVNPRAIRSLNF